MATISIATIQKSILEMNFARLLHHTEDLAVADKAHEARFTSYLIALKQFFSELVESSGRPTNEYIRHYESRLKQLEVAREMALSTTFEERASFLLRPTSPLIPVPVTDDSLVISADIPVKKDNKVGSSKSQSKVLISGYLAQPPNIMRLEEQRLAKTNRHLLLGPEKKQSENVSTSTLADPNPERQRQSQSHLVHKEEVYREELASKMLHMAKHLKDQSSAIGERLQADRQVVEVSVEQADRNAADMTVVLHQLSEELGSRCARVVWVALLVSLVVFFQMIAFMKLFKKRIQIVYSSDRSEL